jgi:hypothetical protein
MSVRPRPSAPDRINAELCSGSTAGFEPVCPGSNPGSAAISFEAKRALCLITRRGLFHLAVLRLADLVFLVNHEAIGRFIDSQCVV